MIDVFDDVIMWVNRKIDAIKYRVFPSYRKYWTVNTGLKPSYYDVDYVILYANFALLHRFIDESGGIEKIRGMKEIYRSEYKDSSLFSYDEEAFEKSYRYLDEIVTLYDYWNFGRHEIEKKIDNYHHILHNYEKEEKEDGSYLWTLRLPEGVTEEEYQASRKEYNDMVELRNKTEDIMLLKIMDIRRKLWD